MYFIKAREGQNQWWRYLVSAVFVFFAYFLGSVPVMIITALKQKEGHPGIDSFVKTMNFETIGIDPNMGLFLLLLPSVISFFAVLFSMIRLHEKPIGSIASSENRIRWNRLITGGITWMILLLAGELIFAGFHPENYTFNFNAVQFILLLLICLAFIPFQAGFEELLFRGLLMQGIGLAFRFRISAVLISSLIFGMLHYTNPEVDEFGAWLTMPYYICFGIFAGLLVVMDNGIELAIGVHIANNLFGTILVNYDSSVLQTPSLFRSATPDPVLLNIAFLGMVVVFMFIMARRYQWSGWKKIYQRIA